MEAKKNDVNDSDLCHAPLSAGVTYNCTLNFRSLPKIVSFNVRGLGKSIKWKFIRNLERKEGVQLLCLQETKKEAVSRELCIALWGNCDVQWFFSPSIGAAGGLLCLWDSNSFSLSSYFQGEDHVNLEDIWKEKNCEVVIVNVYSSCDRIKKLNDW
ncbi:hypothetical protein JHK85_023412 [Glycine max]|nr:hypothetical protein JHK85_023412 [Glycine max]